MSDPYASHSGGLNSPAREHFAITPSDANPLARFPRALRVLTAGNLRVQLVDGDEEITYPVSAGETLPIRARKVLATGTTCTVAGWL